MTNGFTISEVQTALFGRLGWSDSTLNEANRESRSGRKFDDGSFHAMVTVENIKASISPTANINEYLTDKQNAVILKVLSGVFNEPFPTGKDITTSIVEGAFLFDEAIGLCMAEIIMAQGFFTNESNGASRNIKDNAQAAIHLELQGALPIPDSPHIQGIKVRIEKELKRVRAFFYRTPSSKIINLC